MDDTPQEIADLVRDRLLAGSGEERVLMGSRMFDAARDIALASFPSPASERWPQQSFWAAKAR